MHVIQMFCVCCDNISFISTTYTLYSVFQLIRVFYNETYGNRWGEVPSETAITFLWSITVSLFLPGGMAGAFCAGFVADKYGRSVCDIVHFVPFCTIVVHLWYYSTQQRQTAVTAYFSSKQLLLFAFARNYIIYQRIGSL